MNHIKGHCACGNKTISYSENHAAARISWCCQDKPCFMVEYFDQFGNKARNVTCDGRMLSLNETCNSKCNFIPQKNINNEPARSYAKACGETSTICIEEDRLCKGEILCENGKDAKWCKDSQRIQEDCGKKFRKFILCFNSNGTRLDIFLLILKTSLYIFQTVKDQIGVFLL